MIAVKQSASVSEDVWLGLPVPRTMLITWKLLEACSESGTILVKKTMYESTTLPWLPDQHPTPEKNVEFRLQ